MASSHVQIKCERWIVDTWLPKECGLNFSKQKLKMQGKGLFEFDAVSQDKKIVSNISTTPSCTHTGAIASGKKSKLRADCLMLALVNAGRKLMVLTEKSMHDFAIKEQQEGRLPLDIEICHAKLPELLRNELSNAQNVASLEVRGTRPR